MNPKVKPIKMCFDSERREGDRKVHGRAEQQHQTATSTAGSKFHSCAPVSHSVAFRCETVELFHKV